MVQLHKQLKLRLTYTYSDSDSDSDSDSSVVSINQFGMATFDNSTMQ